ncbi:hypothetical protein [Lactococcus protaetiae]|uniref:Uncharacterized protein n=1 Tax=Lactococcus protaetiae TaxID=2592653 RepID=A0A514Z7Z6_9LACT|nr:hypothetical protein [Lactococcus protaetiae]MCL2113110.1 hypothetical protein [Streptococcaceae bacterium]QDK70714.1 hypothetical protein FLP15_05555 [Lactococcus protaetiae]
MKKVITLFTFWGVVVSLLIILLHQVGQDSKSFILIALNPILFMLGQGEESLTFMNSGFQINAQTIDGMISIYWYIASILTFAFYGGIIDFMRYTIKRKRDDGVL